MGNESNRRSFLGRAAAVAGAAATAPLFSACGGGGRQQTGAHPKSGLEAPLPACLPGKGGEYTAVTAL
jgi:putative aldouronate transport system substrate-binding protein